MAKLYFRYGPMNSGKSTRLLQDAFNYEEQGQRVAIAKPSIDTKDTKILSRLGVSRTVDIHVGEGDQFIELFDALDHSRKIDCLFVDEAQFLSESQVNALFYIAVNRGTPVIAYGIRTDFQTNAFPGSKRLLEIAHSLDEMKTICVCGKKAMFNARKVDGAFINDGGQVAIDQGEIEYESMCGECYQRRVGVDFQAL